MKIDYDKDFKKIMAELQTNFGWSNIDMLLDGYKDLLNDTIKAVKNCSISNVLESLPKDTDGCGNDRDKCSCKNWGGCPLD